MNSSFGKNIKVSIFGGSHEPYIGVTLEGLPKGVKIDLAKIEQLLSRRAPGKDALSTGRKEADIPIIRSGLYNGVTFGPPLTIVIENTDTRGKDYEKFSDIPRPSHADYTAKLKYGKSLSMEGGGPFSGRMTAPLCIAGAIAMQILERKKISIGAHISSIGSVTDAAFDPADISKETLFTISKNPFPVLEESKGEEMKALILEAKKAGDSVGGIIECCALNFPAGIGGPMYDGVESALANIFFGIPAVKGVEFGAGFAVSLLRGSTANDPFYMDGAKVKTKTNNHGGILGGITTGMPIIARLAFKPTPSIAIEQDSVSLSRKTNEKLIITGRHDPCVVVRAVPVVEAAMAIGLLDLLLEKF